jgi:hypothetical protein
MFSTKANAQKDTGKSGSLPEQVDPRDSFCFTENAQAFINMLISNPQRMWARFMLFILMASKTKAVVHARSSF